MIITASQRRQWAELLRADEVNLSYFAERSELPGVVLFCTELDDATEFDLALVHDVPVTDVDTTLQLIVDFFRSRHRRPRIRVSPLSAPANWPGRLRRAGFVETDERFVYFSVPETVHLPTNPAVRVERVVAPEDGDRFSAVQVAGYDIPAQEQAWDRELARRHLAAGQYNFYLAWLDGQIVGAARTIHLAGGTTAMAALATLPSARGRGVGTSVFARMVGDARVAGSHLIFGTVIPGSYAAGMYDRLGFISHFETQTFATAA